MADLDVAYGRVQVLFDVNLRVDAGETLALLGTNGAGKSTLLKTVSGLLSPARGTIAFDGVDFTKHAAHRRVEAGIVQLSGGHSVFPGLSVRDNLRVGSFLFLRDRRRVERRVNEVLELFPTLQTRLEQRAGSMSGGEQQIVALAKVLLPEPRLLIIDELSLGLAPVVVEVLLAVIEQLRRDGMTMLIVEQSLNLALAFADRAVFMERGQVRFSGQASDLLEADDLARAVFLGGVSH